MIVAVLSVFVFGANAHAAYNLRVFGSGTGQTCSNGSSDVSGGGAFGAIWGGGAGWIISTELGGYLNKCEELPPVGFVSVGIFPVRVGKVRFGFAASLDHTFPKCGSMDVCIGDDSARLEGVLLIDLGSSGEIRDRRGRRLGPESGAYLDFRFGKNMTTEAGQPGKPFRITGGIGFYFNVNKNR